MTTDWLSRHLEDPDLVVLDCSVKTVFEEDGSFHNESGREDYERGHIDGAGFADLMSDLSDTDSPLEFTVPTPDEFCAAMGRLGVGDNSRVVLYDSLMTGWAARVWRMLRWVGFDRAAVLDGGLQLWTSEGRPLATGPVNRSAKTLAAQPRPELIADRDEVLKSVGDGSVCLIDTMPEEHYRGEQAMYARPGHIPGAINASVFALLDEQGRFKPLDQLAALFTGERNARTITYCGGGIAASATAFALIRLGFTDVAVYTASLQEWAADQANPMVTEPSPA